MFFKIDVLKNFAIFTEKYLRWLLQAFFYRTPMVIASGFLWQQIHFSSESGIHCSHTGFYCELLWKHELNLIQPLKLFCKHSVFGNFANFTGKQLCWNPFFNRVIPSGWSEKTPAQIFFLWNLHNLREHLIWSLLTAAS